MNGPAAAPVHAKTPFGVRVWLVPGRPDVCLAWSGEHDMLRLCRLVAHAGGTFLGGVLDVLTGRLTSEPEACAKAGAWLAANVTGPVDDTGGGETRPA